MAQEKTLTGYPSIDKPWLNQYSEEVLYTSIPKKTMYELLYEYNKSRLDNVAIRYYGNDISYGKLFENIRLAGAAFSAYGVTAGDVVTILSLNTPETTYAIYGLNYIGAVANLLVANTSVQEIATNLKDTKSKLFLVLDKMLEGIGELECPIPIITLSIGDSAKGIEKHIFRLMSSKKQLYISYSEFVREKTCAECFRYSEDSPAIIVYTSGTTGQPKGVVLSNTNINSCAIQCAISGKNYRQHETFLNILPPFYSFGIGMKHLCFYVGMTEIPMLIPKVDMVQKMIKKHRPNRLVIGPAFTDVIEKYSGKDMSFLVDLTGGGGSISLITEKRINEILETKGAKSKYLSGYGMTELSAAVSMNHNDNNKEQSIGLPLPLTNIKICSLSNGEELGYGEEGELLVSSPGLMLGYYNNVEETEKSIETLGDGTRWIHTGDLAKVDEDGFVFVTGRIKRIYIVTNEDNLAYKLFPQRMEEVVQQICGVQKCGVIVKEDEVRGYVPIVFVSSNGTEAYDVVREKTAKEIERNLPEYYKPKDIIVLDKIPVNSNQKIDYHALEQIGRERLQEI